MPNCTYRKYIPTILTILLSLGFSSLAFAQSLIPSGTDHYFSVTPPGGTGDKDGIQVVFFEVPDTYTNPIYFAVYDPDEDNNGAVDGSAVWDPDPENTAASSNFYLIGGTGAFSNDTVRAHYYTALSEATTGTTLQMVDSSVDVPVAQRDEAWFYFDAVYPSQGELIGNRYYFKIVVEASGTTNKNMFKLDISTSNSGTPTGLTNVRSFAYSWTINPRNRAAETWDLYPFLPTGTTTLEAYNWDLDGGETATYDSGVVTSGALTISGNGTTYPTDVANDSIPVGGGEDNKTWQITLTEDGGGPGDGNNVSEFWFEDQSNNILKTYASAYTPNAADYVYAYANDGVEVAPGTERVFFQVVDSSGDPVPRSTATQDFRITLTGTSVTISNTSDAQSGVGPLDITPDVNGFAWADINKTVAATETVTVTVSDASYNFPNDPSHGVVTIDFSPDPDPVVSSSGNLSFTEANTANLQDILITDTGSANMLQNGAATDDIIVRIPTGLSAQFDTTVTTPGLTIGNASAGAVSATVAYPSSTQMEIDVTTDFAVTETLTISGLVFNATNSPSTGQLEVSFDGGTTWIQDDKIITINSATQTTYWTGTTSTTWSDNTNWTNNAPGAGATAYINTVGTGNYPVAPGADPNIANLYIGSGATLTLSGSNFTVTGIFELTGTLSSPGAGTISDIDTNSGTVIYTAGTSLNITTGSAQTYNDLVISGGTFTVGSALTVNGTFSISGGSLTIDNNSSITGTYTQTGGTIITTGADLNVNSAADFSGGTLNVNTGSYTTDSNFTVSNNAVTFTTGGTGAVVFDGTLTLDVDDGGAVEPLPNIQIGSASAGANVTVGSDLDIDGTLTVNNGGATTIDITGRTINIADNLDLTNLDTFTTGSSESWVFDGTTTLPATQDVDSNGLTFNNVTVTKGAAANEVHATADWDIDGTLSLTTGVLAVNDTMTLFLATDLTMTSANGTLRIDGGDASSGTLNLNGTAANDDIDIQNGLILSDVGSGGTPTGGVITGLGTLTLTGGDLTQNGNITAEDMSISNAASLFTHNLGTLTLSNAAAGDSLLKSAGTWYEYGGITDAASQIRTTGGATDRFGNNGSSTVADVRTTTNNDLITIGTAADLYGDATFAAGSGAITISGAIDADAGRVRDLTLNTTGATTISAAVGVAARPLAHVQTNAGGTVSLGADIIADQITVPEAVTLTTNVSLGNNNQDDTGTYTDVRGTFSGTIDGNFNLTLDFGDDTGNGTTTGTTFASTLGATTAIGDGGGGASLVHSGNGTVSYASTVRTQEGISQANIASATITFQDNVTILGTGTDFDSVFLGNLVFDGLTFDSARGVTIGSAVANADQATLSSAAVNFTGTAGAAENFTIYSSVIGNQNLGFNLNANFTLDVQGNQGDDGAPATELIGDGTAAAITINNGGTTRFRGTIMTQDGISQVDDTGSVQFDGDVTLAFTSTNTVLGSTVIFDGMTFTSAGTVQIGSADSDADQWDINTAVSTLDTSATNRAVDVYAEIDLAQNLTITTGSGNITLRDIVDATTAGTEDITLNSTGTTAIQSAIGGVTRLGTVTTNAGGTTQIGADITSDILSVGNNATLTASVTLGNGGLSGAGSFDVYGSFAGTLNGAFDLTLNYGLDNGTDQVTTFTGAVGGTTPIGDGTGAAIIINSPGDTQFANTLDTADGITQTDDIGTVQFDGDVTVALSSTNTVLGSTVIFDGMTFTSAGTVQIGSADSDADQWDINTAVSTLTTAAANTAVDVYAEIDLAQNLTIATGSGNITLRDIVDATTAGTEDITLNSTGTTAIQSAIGGVTRLGTVTTNAGGTTQIGADITSDILSVGNNATLTASVTLGNGGLSGAGSFDVYGSFAGTLNGAFDLTLNYGLDNGTDQVTTFTGAVGGTTPIGDGTGAAIIINSPGDTQFANTLGTADGITQTDDIGTVQFDGDVTVALSSTNTVLGSTVVFDGMTFTSAGTVQIGSADSDADQWDINTAVSTLTTAATNTAVDVYAEIDLAQNLTITTGSGNITLRDIVDATTAGTEDITLNSTGTTDIQSAIGGVTRLGTVTTNAGGTTQIGADITADILSVGNNATLTASVTLGNGGVSGAGSFDVYGSFAGTLNGAFDLTLNYGLDNGTDQVTTFTGAVGSGTALGDGADAGTDTIGEAITINSPGDTLFSSTLVAQEGVYQADGVGQVQFNGDVTLTGGLQSQFLSNLRLDSGMTLYHRTADIQIGSDNADFLYISTGAATVDTDGAAGNEYDITINADIESVTATQSLNLWVGNSYGAVAAGDYSIVTINGNIGTGVVATNVNALNIQADRIAIGGSSSAIITNGTQTYDTNTSNNSQGTEFLTPAGGITLDSNGSAITFNDLYINSAAGGTLTLNDDVTVDRFSLLRGDLDINGNTLTVNQDFVALGYTGANPIEDPERGAGGEVEWQYPEHTSLNNGTARADFDPFDAATPAGHTYTGTFADLAGSTITVSGDFYVNGVNIDGTAAWNLNLPDNRTADPITNTPWGAPYAITLNNTVQNSSVGASTVAIAANTVTASSGAGTVSVTDGGGNDTLTFGGYTQPVAGNTYADTTDAMITQYGFDFTRTIISSGQLVADDVIAITFNKPILNRNDEIMTRIGSITADPADDNVAFSGSYLDGTTIPTPIEDTTDGSGGAATYNFLQTIYIQVTNTHSFRTDATGSADGNAQNGGLGDALSTDSQGRQTATYGDLIADIQFTKGILFGSSGADLVIADGTNNDDIFNSVSDNLGPALVRVDAGRDNSTAAAYDSHNFFRLVYSEPVNIGDSTAAGAALAGFNIGDAATLAQSEYDMPANGTVGGDIRDNGSTNVIVDGYFTYDNPNYPGVSGQMYRGTGATTTFVSGNNTYNSLIKTDDVTLFIYLSGWSAASVWSGWHLNVPDPYVDGTTIDVQPNTRITDRSGNQLDEAESDYRFTNLVANTYTHPFYTANVTTDFTSEPTDAIDYWDVIPPGISSVGATANSLGVLPSPWGNFSDEPKPHEIILLSNDTDTDTDRFEIFIQDNLYMEDNIAPDTPLGTWDPLTEHPNTAARAITPVDGGAAIAPPRGIRDNTISTGTEAGDSFFVGVQNTSMGTVGAQYGQLSSFGTGATFDTQTTNNTYNRIAPNINAASDDPYFSIQVDTSAEPWSNLTDLYLVYRYADSYATDLAGNLMPNSGYNGSFYTNPVSFPNYLTQNPWADTVVTTENGFLYAIERTPATFELTLSAANGSRIYVMFDEPVWTDLARTDNQLVSGDFSLTGGVPPTISSIDIISTESGSGTPEGVKEAFINLSRALTADEIFLVTLQAVASEVYDRSTNYMLNTVSRRISDIGIGVIAPVWATDGVQDPSQGTGFDYLRTFTGGGGLSDFDITLQASIATTNTYGYWGLPVSMYYDVDVSSAYLNGQYWSPTQVTGFVDANTEARLGVLSNVTGRLREFDISAADSELVSGNTMDFIFFINGIPTGWVSDPNDPRSPQPWTIDIGGVLSQRGGVTILNNVINPDDGDKTILQLELERSGFVTASVFTLDGDLVRVLHRGRLAQGNHVIEWDGKNVGNRSVARGLYMIRVVGPNIDEFRKVLVVR